MQTLDRMFVWIRNQAWLYRFTWVTRILLAAGFFPTGLVKLMGHRFTLLSVDNPVGAFFEAMYQTGLYWRFLGLSQMIAALLLLIPRLSHLGAAFFLPIILNIFVITVALPFRGTPVVTGLMLLAVTWLVVWDYHRFRALFFDTPMAQAVPMPKLTGAEKLAFWGCGLSLMAAFFSVRSFIANQAVMASLALGVVSVLYGLYSFFTRLKPHPS